MDGFQWIKAVAHDHHAADGLGASFIESTTPQGGSLRDVRDITHADRHVVAHTDRNGLDVIDTFYKAQTPNDVLGAIHLNGASTHIEVGGFGCPEDIIERDAKRPHRIRVDIDLVFLDIAADGAHFADAFRSEQRIAHVPVLDGSQLFQAPSSGRIAIGVQPLQGVPVDLPQRRGVRTECRLHVGGHRALRQ